MFGLVAVATAVMQFRVCRRRFNTDGTPSLPKRKSLTLLFAPNTPAAVETLPHLERRLEPCHANYALVSTEAGN